MKLETEVERDFRRHLVGSVGKRGYEQQPRRVGSEELLIRGMDRLRLLDERLQYRPQPLVDRK